MTDFKPQDEKAEQAELVPDSNPTVPSETGNAYAFSPGNIIRHYKVLSHLGSGGMSDVYTCEDMTLKRIVAFKVFRAVGISNAQLLRRFQTEGKAIARLEHPNILKLYGFETTEDGQPFLIMEYVSGMPLSSLLSHGASLPVQRVLRLAGQMCDALAAAHQAGVIHRDLKPSNIMVVNAGTQHESIKLLDFGIAKLQDEGGGTAATRTGDVFGTPQYMSPEQAQGKHVDSRADQYSLGCVIYHMLAGKPPFSGDSALAVMMSHLKDRPPSLAKEKPGIPLELQRAIEKLLEKDPDNRFSDMEAAKQALLGEVEVGSSRGGTALLLCALLIGAVFVAVAYFALNHNHTQTQINEPKTATVAPHVVPGENESSAYEGRAVSERFLQWVLKHQNMSVQSKDTELSKDLMMDLKDSNLAILRGRKDITVLNLKGCTEITNDGLKYIADLPLKRLTLTYTGLTDKPLPALSAIKSLEFLDLRSTRIGDEAIRYIFPLENLGYLNVSDTRIKDPKYLLNTLSHRLKLGSLYLDRCPVGGQLKALSGSNIKVLSLVAVNNLTAQDFDTIVSLPHLGVLDCNDTNITDKQLLRLANKQLGELKIAYCPNLHREAVREFIRRKPVKLYSDWWSEPLPLEFHATQGPDLVTNGCFELQGANTPWTPLTSGSSALRGWKIVQGSVNVLSEKYCIPADGKFSVELSRREQVPAILQQDLKTMPGVDYVVHYYAAPHYVSDAKKTEFKISAGSGSQDVMLDHDPRQKQTAMYWQHLELPFKATAKITTLTFANPGREEGLGACISAVSVYRVK